MVKKTILALVLYLIVVAVIAVWVAHIQTILFHSAFWELVAAVIVGAVAGTMRAKLKLRKQATTDNELAPRHTVGSFMEHWGTGFGTILLIVSAWMLGSVLMPQLSGTRMTAINIHYIGVFFTLIFGCYFLADFLASGGYKVLMPGPADIWDGTIKKYLLRKKWNDTAKYLSSQKSAFLVFAILGAGILVTGAIKTVDFVLRIPPQILNSATHAHDIFAALFIIMLIVHVLSTAVVPSHWRSFFSWFTGKEEHRH